MYFVIIAVVWDGVGPISTWEGGRWCQRTCEGLKGQPRALAGWSSPRGWNLNEDLLLPSLSFGASHTCIMLTMSNTNMVARAGMSRAWHGSHVPITLSLMPHSRPCFKGWPNLEGQKPQVLIEVAVLRWFLFLFRS